MKKKLNIIALTGVIALYASAAQAIPTLQLDILGGTYNTTTETVISNGDIFTLYAYLIEDKQGYNTVGNTYFISAALTPKTSTDADLGSFFFAGADVDATADMVYGTPPLLPGHGLFDTYYKEFSFIFNSANEADQANVENDAGDGPQVGTGMYYASFDINTSSLADGYEIHFDLYAKNIRTSNDKPFLDFAPFSHDAESKGAPVPEPATMLLFGTGLVGLAGFRLRRKKK